MSFGIVPGWKRRPRQCDLEDRGEDSHLGITSRTNHSLQRSIVASLLDGITRALPASGLSALALSATGSEAYGNIPPHYLPSCRKVRSPRLMLSHRAAGRSERLWPFPVCCRCRQYRGPKIRPRYFSFMEHDRTIPSMASTVAAEQLKAAGFQVEIDIEPRVGHTISLSGANKALQFLRRRFCSPQC